MLKRVEIFVMLLQHFAFRYIVSIFKFYTLGVETSAVDGLLVETDPRRCIKIVRFMFWVYNSDYIERKCGSYGYPQLEPAPICISYTDCSVPKRYDVWARNIFYFMLLILKWIMPMHLVLILDYNFWLQ